jgi:hypothetical protein
MGRVPGQARGEATVTTTQTQQNWDLEEALDFRRKVRELTANLNNATDAEKGARSNYAIARRNTAKARAELQAYVERDMSPADIVAAGFPADAVAKVVRLIKLSEYKRRQSAVGIRITARGFGKDWRYPITSAWNDWAALPPNANVG